MKVAGPTCRPWMGAAWLLPSAPGGTTSATLLSPSLRGRSRMAMARDSFLTAGLLLARCLQQGGGQVQGQDLWPVHGRATPRDTHAQESPSSSRTQAQAR